METGQSEIVEQVDVKPILKNRHEINKKYYDSHREKILLHQKKLRDEIMPLQFCECGEYKTTMCSNMYRHRRSARHMKAMQLKQLTNDESNLIQTH